MKNKNILFDLDGTLTDSKEGIINGVAYALKEAGHPVEDKESLVPFIGPPILESFMAYDGASREEAQARVQTFRSYYTDRGVWENELYPGIQDMLASLGQAKLYVATAKREDYVLPILEHFKIDHYFSGLVGAPIDGRVTFKEEIIAQVIEKYQLDPKASIMVGDHVHDMEGAQAHGMDFIAALYGYGDQEKLVGAKYQARDVRELREVLEGILAK